MRGKTLKQRFDQKFILSPGCWLWIGKRDTYGYGQIKRDGKFTSAHRISHELYIGPIPGGLVVRHKCDTPLCVNPDHLVTGTYKENMKDKFDRNRQPDCRGSNNGRSKLSDEQVIAIRSDNRPRKIIATDYGISQTQVFSIKNMRSWKHIPADQTTAQQGE